MKRLRFLVAGILLFVPTPWSGLASAAAIDDLVAAAKKEGTLDVYAPSGLTPPGAQALADALNKKYGLSIRVNYPPGHKFTGDVGKMVGLATAGLAPEWDVMVIHDAGHATLWRRKLHKLFEYKKLGVNSEMIHYDNGTVTFANQFALPAYNSKVLPAKDVPKRWEDLVDPKWKGGRLGVSNAVHHVARLATVWGETKATEFAKALARQQPFLGTLPALSTRLEIGEIHVAFTLLDSFIHRAKVSGAPIVFAEGIEPVISPALHAGVLKGALHPNAGHLFTAFLSTSTAQEIWERYEGQSSALIPGTRAYKYAQGKTVLYMTQHQAEMMDRLTREYGRILGWTK
ncbi:MAG: substrate-binding domain-containing protein [Deltaproteobacteria bacterium]|nr:substrate-binding domain-containing protein [Deltaproteobacteria bacterium]